MPGHNGPSFTWEDLLHNMGIDTDSDYFKSKKPLTKKQKIVWGIIAVLLLAFFYWWFHPVINIHSSNMWWFICLLILLPIFIIFRTRSTHAAAGSLTEPPDEALAKRYKNIAYIPVVILALVVLGGIASLSIIPGNAERYTNILKTQDYDFATDIQEVDYNSIPVIDRDSAVLLGNRTLGEIPEYVSQFEISGLYSQINYRGKPVRVSPLGYADFFKWLNQQENGLPGYVIVDMASQATKVVRTDDGIKFSQSEPFDRNIDRYVQLKYPFAMFGEKSFEIDEDGHPWWVCPIQDFTIGLFGGETISNVVLVDACTGETQEYAVGDVPEWVDRVYPSDLLIQQYNWSGLYLNGWLNSWLGQTGVKQTTPGANGDSGYNYLTKGNDVWMYTGVTSATADNSIIGFVLINQRTAESHFYSVSGATEESAMGSAEGQVQNLRYSATFPLLLNINGQPTYFMALKDSVGLVKKYAMLDIQRYQNVAVGDTVSDCQKSYKALLATNGAAGTNAVTAQTVSGTIDHMATAVIDGNSHYYLKLVGDTRIYDCPLPSLIQVVAYKEGDTITLHFNDETPTCPVTSIS